MVNYVYESLCRYFEHLCNVGYMSQDNVSKLLILSCIQRLVECDFRGHLNEEDYNKINDALYNIYGTSCLVPYPEYYNNKDRRIMYNCSISELANRVSRIEQEGTGGTTVVATDENGNTIIVNNKPVVTPGESVINISVDLNALNEEQQAEQ